MAVLLLNQSRYRRSGGGSRDRLNTVDSDGNDLWIFQSTDTSHRCCNRLDSRLDDDGVFRTCVGATPEDPHHICTLRKCERVTINVSGQYYETWAAILNRHPDTMLGDPKKRMKYYDRRRHEYFFDRHRPTFEVIFNYFIYGGHLHRPERIPDEVFVSELEFFGIEEAVVQKYKESEGYIKSVSVMPEKGWQKTLWKLFEHPETSYAAYFIAILSVIITLISIILFCVETLPQFAKTHCEPGERPNFFDSFFIIESTCTAWFTLEVVIRFAACPSKVGFFKDFNNWVDTTAVIPYYITLTNVLVSMSCDSAKSSASLAFLRVFRLIRIFKLTKHSAGLQVLVLTFKASMKGLMLFLVALIVCILLFSSAIYYAEIGLPDSQINSIPDGFWWAVITMTTVGYGDRVPVGVWGRLIGSVCALTGVLTLAIPVPIITENFNKFYAHKTGRGRS